MARLVQKILKRSLILLVQKAKKKTKAYVNAKDNCTFNVEREIRKKEEKGYIEYVNGKPVKEEVTSIDFSKCLPKNFCSYKPQTDIKPAALEKLHKAGNAFYTRKYDGMMHLLCTPYLGLGDLYSSHGLGI